MVERSRAGLNRTRGRKARIAAAGAKPEEGSIRLTRHSSTSRRWAGEILVSRGNAHAGRTVFPHLELTLHARLTNEEERNGPAEFAPESHIFFEPVLLRLARNTIIESTFEVGRRFRCTMRVDCGRVDPGAVIRPDPGEWYPRMPDRLDEDELADWRSGRDAIYQLAALTVGARLAVAEG